MEPKVELPTITNNNPPDPNNNNNNNNNNNTNNNNTNNNNNNPLSELPTIDLTLNKNNPNGGTFATGIDYIKTKKDKSNKPVGEDEEPKLDGGALVIIKSPTFYEIRPPHFDPNNLSLSIPVDLIKIKKNAFNSINSVGKKKFGEFLKNPALNELIDALVSDSFWFVVCFFQSKNENIIKRDDELKIKEKKKLDKENKLKLVSEILSRMSCTYFKFFIRVCDFGPTRKNDTALNAFNNFMSHSVYYSIYLAFPKSRHLFNEDFRNRIVYFFTYLFNGLASENNFIELKWGLDLGKGDIIETTTKIKDSIPMELPTMNELQDLINRILKKQDTIKKKGKKSEINTDILNTPLYRIYAETNKFETLNLVKPIKMSNRKIIDIEKMNKVHAGYIKYAKDTIKNAADRKDKLMKELKKKEEEYLEQIYENKDNEDRVRKELAAIKVQRAQEYANYCIFLSK